MKLNQTRKYLAQLFGVDQRWITKKMKEIGITHRGILTPLDLELLSKAVGDPNVYKKLFRSTSQEEIKN
jgi:hypothetical protein